MLQPMFQKKKFQKGQVQSRVQNGQVHMPNSVAGVTF